MTAKLIGYARVSTAEQNADRQQEDLLAVGVRPDDLYIDHGISGARANRPGLNEALTALQPGDTLVITTLDRLGRSTQNMLTLASQLQEGGISLRVLNLGGGVVDTSSPMGRMLFTVMSALAEMELDIKKERIRDSVAKRRAHGGNLGGRPARLTDDMLLGIQNDVKNGISVAEACRARGVQRGSYYRRLKEMKAVC